MLAHELELLKHFDQLQCREEEHCQAVEAACAATLEWEEQPAHRADEFDILA